MDIKRDFKSGLVRFVPMESGQVQTEAESRSNKITSNPVEQGADINDHVIPNPVQFTISGTVVGGLSDAERLKKMQETGDIVSYTGKTHIEQAVISKLDINCHSKNMTGFDFKLTFQSIHFVGAEYVPLGETVHMSQLDLGADSALEGTVGTSNEGLKTTAIANISGGAYAQYVNSYAGKQTSSNGPITRRNPSYSGVR